MNHVDLKYAGFLSIRLERFSIKSTHPYRANFRCPICGDSQKSKAKTRGWLLEKENSAIYYCHNCGASMGMQKLLETMFPALYNEYVTDIIMEKKSLRKLEPKAKDVDNLDKLLQSRPKFTKTGSPLLKIKKVSSLPVGHPVRNYIEKRKIPVKEHYRLYYAPKFNSWVNTMLPNKLSDKFDEPRLITPFIDTDDNLFGFAGRSFDPKASLRYITIMLDESMPKVFGLDKVDFSKRYYVTEGQIDSLFLNNAIAMAGADGNAAGLHNTHNAVFVFDNEPRNKEIVARMQKVIDRGHAIVILSDKLSVYGKDINDMVINELKPVDIEMILEQNTYSGLEAKLALTMWKRV